MRERVASDSDLSARSRNKTQIESSFPICSSFSRCCYPLSLPPVATIFSHRQPSSPNMIACGPFCVLCQRALRVEPCSCSYNEIGDCVMGDDVIGDGLARLDGNPSPTIIGTMIVILSPTANTLRPRHMSGLASVMQWKCPSGVFVFHLQLKACCRFLANGSVQTVSPKQAMCTLCSRKTQLGFAILRDGSLADLSVYAPSPCNAVG